MPKNKEKKLYPHFSVYYDNDIGRQLKSWMRTRGIKSKSQGILLILREYFEFYNTIDQKIKQVVDRRFAELTGR